MTVMEKFRWKSCLVEHVSIIIASVGRGVQLQGYKHLRIAAVVTAGATFTGKIDVRLGSWSTSGLTRCQRVFFPLPLNTLWNSSF